MWSELPIFALKITKTIYGVLSMKCKYLFLLPLVSLVSCNSIDFDPTQINEEVVKHNTEITLGVTIDPNHTWNTIQSGTITVTADADLEDIVKVQILTESPFLNNEAVVLNEVEAHNGDKVTLSYDAPDFYEELIAACVNKDGLYFVKSFSTQASSVSFSSKNGARTRGAADNLNMSAIVLNGADTKQSFAAGRTIFANLAASATNGDTTYLKKFSKEKNIYLWEGAKWEKELLWQASSIGEIGSSWRIQDGAIVRDIDGISDDEKSQLKAIFNGFLGRSGSGNNKQNNLEAIRRGTAVQLFNNHLTSDGKSPITLIPVQMASTDLPKVDIYYYYYNPANVPSDMSEADYIKQLPKFKAIPCNYTRGEAGVNSGALAVTEFFKKHEYLLPYYGDGDLKQNGDCHVNSTLYRIKNGQKNNKKDYYLTYLGQDDSNSDKMKELIADDDNTVGNQLWQIITTSDNRTVFYNVGSGKFMTGVGSYLEADNRSWATIFTDYLPIVKYSAFYLDGENIWFDSNKTRALGSNLGKNYRVATDKTKSNGNQIIWYFEEYTGSKSFNKLSELTLDGSPVGAVQAVSNIIPAGYRIGFVSRKNKSGSDNMANKNILKEVESGCVYGYGKLNTIINNFPGHFASAKTIYKSMRDDDPRVAMFSANGKSYLTFEDGCDCNFSDLIVEINNGVDNTKIYEDLTEISNATYTMCFEDRPENADYDMNDVVLRARRVKNNSKEIWIELVACGAEDEVVLHGITESRSLEGREIHDILGLTGDKPFANTQNNDKHPIVSEKINIGDKTIKAFLRNVYIENKTTGQIIQMPTANGQPPYAIIVPYDFKYPMEGKSIKSAYPGFLEWVQDMNAQKDWYVTNDDNLIYR